MLSRVTVAADLPLFPCLPLSTQLVLQLVVIIMVTILQHHMLAKWLSTAG